MTLVADGPKRFLLGSLLLLLGGIALLIAQQVYEPPPIKRNNNDEETDIENDEATAITAVILCALVICFAFFAIIVLIFVIRMINQKEKEQMKKIQESEAEIENKNKNKNIFEWFFYPDFPSIDTNNIMILMTKRRTELYREVSWNSLSRILLMAPSVALFLVIVVRLFAGAANFEAVPYYLDFGWKYGLLPHNRTVEMDGDKLYNEPAEKSIAYTVVFDTYGHAIQGFLSSFLAFPTVFHFLIRTLTCSSSLSPSSPSSSSPSSPSPSPPSTSFCFLIWKNLVLLAPWAFTIYPFYNLVKRYIKAGEAFAGSSFANNGFEWSSGFILGMAIGNLVTSAVLFRRISKEEDFIIECSEDNRPPSNVNSQQEQDKEASSPPWWKVWETDKDESGTRGKQSLQENPSFCIKILQVLFGIILLFTCFAGSMLFGTTWHGCLDGSPDECVNFSADGARAPLGIFVTFIIIPSAIFVCSILF